MTERSKPAGRTSPTQPRPSAPVLQLHPPTPMKPRPTDPPIVWAECYEALGWTLCALEPGQKAPKVPGWNDPAHWLDDVGRIRAQWQQTPTYGMGLVHAGSGTVAIDVDDIEHTRLVFSEFGMDLDALLAGAPRIRGKKTGRDKAIFRAPDGEPLPMHKAAWKRGPKDVVTLFELRAGAVHDVLPPSLHPDGHRYEWTLAPWDLPNGVPELPDALLAFWREFPALKEQIAALDPKAAARPLPDHRLPTAPKEGHNDVIGAFNRAASVHELLTANGYEQVGRRYLAPSSTSKLPGVSILADGRVYSHHGSDVLADGHAHDAFDLFTTFQHGGNRDAALRAASALLGLPVYGTAAPRMDFTALLGTSRADAPPADSAAPRPVFRTVSIMEGDPPPPPSVQIEDLVLDRDINLWAGYGGSAKSTLLLTVAVSVAVGRPVFGTLAVRRPGPVLLVVPEDGEEGARMILDAIVTGLQLSADERALLTRRLRVVADDEMVDLTDRNHGILLRNTAEDHGAVLVIIDPARNVIAPTSNGKPPDVAWCLHALRRELCRGAGAAVVLAHHNRKPGNGAGSYSAPSAHDVRDDVAWVNSSRLVFSVMKQGSRVTLTATKSNRLRGDIRHECLLEIDADPDNKARWLSCRVTDTAVGQAAAEALAPATGHQLTDNQRAALEFLHDPHEAERRVSWAAWRKGSRLNENTLKSVKTRLIDLGFAEANPTGRPTRNGSPEYVYAITAGGLTALGVGPDSAVSKGEG